MPAKRPPARVTPSLLESLADAPWYVRVGVGLLVQFGFPVATTVVLFMIFIGYIPSPLTGLDKNMDLHMKDMHRMMAYMEASQRVGRQICRNTSTNIVEKQECDR